MDLTNDPEKKSLIKFLLSPAYVGRPYIVSKAVPADRLAALRKGFDAALKDPELLAEAEKLQLPVVGSLTGEEAAAYIAEMYKASPEVIADARKITE
jgi:tripartite-type tricarboxylate transporter receptor subunit TctC